LKPGCKCPAGPLECIDENGNENQLETFFSHDHQDSCLAGKSIGLIQIAKELDIFLPPKLKLKDYRNAMSSHPAFQLKIKLE